MSATVHGDFSGSGVLVTGGAQGIGQAIARWFADAGAFVAVLDRDADRLAAARELAAGTRSVVLLKGPTTVVAGPDGDARLLHAVAVVELEDALLAAVEAAQRADPLGGGPEAGPLLRAALPRGAPAGAVATGSSTGSTARRRPGRRRTRSACSGSTPSPTAPRCGAAPGSCSSAAASRAT